MAPGETGWRRRKLDSWELDADFLEQGLTKPVVSERRLTRMSRRDSSSDEWEFRYLDRPDGAPTWSSVTVPSELKPFNGATIQNLNMNISVRDIGAEGTRVLYAGAEPESRSVDARQNPAVIQVDTTQPGSQPKRAIAVDPSTIGLVAFVGADMLTALPELEELPPENQAEAELREKERICGFLTAYSLATRARRIIGSPNGNFRFIAAANDEFLVFSEQEPRFSYNTTPRHASLPIQRRFPEFQKPLP